MPPTSAQVGARVVFGALGVLVLVTLVVLFVQKYRQTPAPAPSPVVQQTETPPPADAGPEYVGADGYGFDVPEGYTVSHSTSGQSESWVITAKPTPEQESPLPELYVRSTPGTTPLSAETTLTILQTEKYATNGVGGMIYLIEEVENAACPTVEFIIDGRTTRFTLHECLDSKIFEEVVESFRNGSAPTEAQNDLSLRIGQSATLANGVEITLVQINDSRCKPGVVCIWQGELAAEIRYQDGSGVTTLHLGLETKSCDRGLQLRSITETSAIFTAQSACSS